MIKAPVKLLRQAELVVPFELNGNDYFALANTGRKTKLSFLDEDDAPTTFQDAVRTSAFELDPKVYPDPETWQRLLGRCAR